MKSSLSFESDPERPEFHRPELDHKPIRIHVNALVIRLGRIVVGGVVGLPHKLGRVQLLQRLVACQRGFLDRFDFQPFSRENGGKRHFRREGEGRVLADRVEVREAEQRAAHCVLVVVSEGHEFDVLRERLGEVLGFGSPSASSDCFVCEGESGWEVEQVVQLAAHVVGGFNCVQNQPVPPAHGETRALAAAVAQVAVRAHLAGRRVDVIAAAHRFVEWFLNSSNIVLQNSPVNHHLDLARGQRRSAHRRVGDDDELRVLLFVFDRDHCVDGIVVSGNGFGDVVRLRVGFASLIIYALHQLPAVAVGFELAFGVERGRVLDDHLLSSVALALNPVGVHRNWTCSPLDFDVRLALDETDDVRRPVGELLPDFHHQTAVSHRH
mmetsp:Transcript_12325/g.22407  ORF Transcript_12325/g.22407 Transcript_12325/m.22407 type:complete len:381 (-) Transcript_12325:108-1250(-)